MASACAASQFSVCNPVEKTHIVCVSEQHTVLSVPKFENRMHLDTRAEDKDHLRAGEYENTGAPIKDVMCHQVGHEWICLPLFRISLKCVYSVGCSVVQIDFAADCAPKKYAYPGYNAAAHRSECQLGENGVTFSRYFWASIEMQAKKRPDISVDSVCAACAVGCDTEY